MAQEERKGRVLGQEEKKNAAMGRTAGRAVSGCQSTKRSF
jgi:hypothetical protein